MRIRKHSVALLLSSTGRSTSTGDESKGREFLLPLVAAAIMDVQAADATPQPQRTAPPQIPESGICTRSAHNWRNALLQCTAKSDAMPADREYQKANYTWNGITGNRVDKCSFEHEISELYRKRELPKSRQRFEKPSVWRPEREHDLGVQKNRQKQVHPTRFDVNSGRKDGTHVRKKESTHNHKPETDKETKNNNDAGSQCKRRNGRGWRCSERTLVGYSLCEHHLGKGRFKSLNDNIGPGRVVVNNKGNKIKELNLIQSVSSKVDFP